MSRARYFSRIKGEVQWNQRGEAAEGKRREASAKPKRTVAEGGEEERGEDFGKTEAHGGWRGRKGMGVLCFALFYLML